MARLDQLTAGNLPPIGFARRMLRRFGVDRAVGYSLLTQGWNFLIRPVSLYMTLKYLTEEERGYFYTFGSILGLQIFFDLGIGVAMQFSVSHETGRLQWTAAGTLEGDPRAKSRLGSLVRLMVRWYAVMAAAFALALVPVGWWVFSQRGTGDIAWHFPWVWTVVAAVAGLLTTPATMLLNGSGRVADVAKFNSVQAVAVNGTQWLVLAAGGGLFSLPAGTTVGVVFFAVWLVWLWRPLLRDLLRLPRDGPKVDWWREIWPFQWKIAISFPFGYLIYYLFTPVVFIYFGPEEAGRMGMSLAVSTLITGVSLTWINTRMPRYGQMIARREWTRLDVDFRKTLFLSTGLAVVGAAAGWAVIASLQTAGHAFGNSFLPALPLALLLANSVLNHVIFAVSGYIRSFRRDPYVIAVIAMGLSMAAAMFGLGRIYGAAGMVTAYLVLNTVFCVVCVRIFQHYRRAWQAAEPEPATESA